MKFIRSRNSLSAANQPRDTSSLKITYRRGRETVTISAPYTMTSLASAMIGLSNGDVDKVDLVDENHVRTIVERTSAETAALMHKKAA